MGKLVRCISVDGALTVMALDSTDIVARAERIHRTSAVASAALGRLLTAASMMGAQLKGADNSVTLRLNGGGPAGTVLAVADSCGNARGYIGQPVVELPLNAKGKLDVAGAVGTDGTLTVIKDLGLKEPYVGQIPLVSGEIAEDITQYFAASEQVPTVCALGVLVNPDLSIRRAGGFLIQLLPAADDAVIDAVERCVAEIPPVTKLLEDGLTPQELCRAVLPEFTLETLDEAQPVYRCNCSRERVLRALAATGRESVEELAQDPVTEVCCQFCDKKYQIESAELKALLRES
ncbi:MAG TPA: Hsp33 family molecular chaperone HslO [Candidatus Fimivicinus intestinavium]|nr:Hsp33 family molecular chaperone HslO [Candidatus Fimivicinus intestinavium]